MFTKYDESLRSTTDASTAPPRMDDLLNPHHNFEHRVLERLERIEATGGKYVMMGETERIVHEGLKQALMAAVANLYRVYTSPDHSADYEAAFQRGIDKHMTDYERMIELIEQRKQV